MASDMIAMLSGLIVSLASGSTSVMVLPAQLDAAALSEVPAGAIDEVILTSVSTLGSLSVMGRADVAAMLTLERQRDLLGCQDTTCLSEIAGALDVDKLVAVQIAQVSGEWNVSAKLVQLRGQLAVERRVTELVRGDGRALALAVGPIVRRLFEGAGAGGSQQLGLDLGDPQRALDQLDGFIAPHDFMRYVRSIRQSGQPTPLADWISSQNQESTALLVAEIVACSALGGFGVWAANRPAAASTSLAATAGVACALLPILDWLDIGAVVVRGATPAIASGYPLLPDRWR